jgi:hypothetical protein
MTVRDKQWSIQSFPFIYSGIIGIFDKLISSFCPQSKTLKDQYLAGLRDLHEISMKLQGDNHVPPQMPANLREEASFKGTLKRSLHSLQINKNCVQLSLEENTPMYKKQITDILNSKEWTSEEAFHRSAAQD